MSQYACHCPGLGISKIIDTSKVKNKHLYTKTIILVRNEDCHDGRY